MKKLVSMILALVMVFSVCAACADTLVVATNPEFPPFEYVEDGQAVGFEMDMAAEIAKDLGMDLQIESMAFDSVITAVMTGKATIAFSGITITDERRMNVDFSEPYFTATQACIVKVGGPVTDAESLKGKLIGVQLGTTGDLTAETFTDTNNVSRFSKALDAVMELQGGKIDAVIVDLPVAKALVSSIGDDSITILWDVEFEKELYGIAIAKGNKELLDGINASLARMTEDGTMDALLVKYFAE